MRAIIVLGFLLLSSVALARPPSLNAAADQGLGKEVGAARRFDLTRLENQAQLRRFIAADILVEVSPAGRGFVLDDRIGNRASANRRLYRYARPYTRCFIERLGEQYQAKFGGRLRITSLVRTCAYQRRLARGNANAARCDQSSHLTGATLDISYADMPSRARRWVEAVLLELERAGLAQATKEYAQPAYHIMVYPTYARHRACQGR